MRRSRFKSHAKAIKEAKLKTDFVGYILVVDDDEQVPPLIRSVLRRYGHYIEHASSAIIAEKMMQDRPPDLVLLDNEMPLKSGIQFLAEIRNKEDFQFLPVIMLTGDALPTLKLSA